MLRQSTLALEYVRSAVARDDASDPTGDVVKLAFMSTTANPGSGDWKTSDWETVSGIYYARCLVGPGGTVTLTAGDYHVWVKVTDNPEIPVRKAGILRMY